MSLALFNPAKKYQTIAFDCDGVLLDSNAIKTISFANVARQYGEDAARLLVNYHLSHGGISRYRKFSYLLTEILKHQSADEEAVKRLAEEYGEQVYQSLLVCEVAPGLRNLRARFPDTTWMIVSGGDQNELRQIFSHRGLDDLFDGGIYGSPTSKDEIFSRARTEGRLRFPAIYIGDSSYDHQSAVRAGIDFCFAYGWSEFRDWQSYCQTHAIPYVKDVKMFGEKLVGK